MRSRTIFAALSRVHGSICAYCHSPLTADDYTVDHIIPTSDGGSEDDAGNKVLACCICNRAKLNLPLSVFYAWLNRVRRAPVPLVPVDAGVRQKTGSDEIKIMPCEFCGTVMERKRKWQRFCSGKCRQAQFMKDNYRRLSDVEIETRAENRKLKGVGK